MCDHVLWYMHGEAEGDVGCLLPSLSTLFTEAELGPPCFIP